MGVDNSAGHAGLRVRGGGSIRQFSVGVLLARAAGARVSHLALTDLADFGIIAVDSTAEVIEDVALSDPGTSGVLLVRSRNALVSESSVSGSHGFGIFLSAVVDSRIQRNALTGNDHGIAVFSGSSGNTVQRNAVSRSGGSAIDVGGDGAEGNRVERNRLIDNGDGIIVGDSNDTLIERNVVSGTGSFGFPDTGGFGILLDGTDRNTVRRNVVTGGRGPAISITTLDSPTAAMDNVVVRNVAQSRLSDGVVVGHGAMGTLVVGNTASDNGDDGIDVEAVATTLRGNTADRNHDLGIEAVPGVRDGGHNRASANGNPKQCTNLRCS